MTKYKTLNVKLSNSQVSRLSKAFANNSSADIKLSKTQLRKIGKSGGFLGRLLGPLLQTCFPLMKNVLKPLGKSVLIPLAFITAASATDKAIKREIFGFDMTTLIILNKEMNKIMEIVKSLEESHLLVKGMSKTTKNKAKQQRRECLGMLLGTLGNSLLGKLLTGKERGAIRAVEGTIRAGDGATRAGQDFYFHLIF